MCIYEEDIHVQGLKNGTTFCETACYLSRGILFHLRVQSPSLKSTCELLPIAASSPVVRFLKTMDEARINLIAFFQAA